MQTKTCTRCSEHRPATKEHFAPHKQCRGGLGPYCRPCTRAIRQAFKTRHGARLKARRRELYAIQNGEKHKAAERRRAERAPFLVTAQNLRNGISDRSKRLGLTVSADLKTVAFIEAWLRKQPNCECCGCAFALGPKNGRPMDESPSFDRFDPSKGYEISNVVLICWRCNNIKRNYSAVDLQLVADWMKRRVVEICKNPTKPRQPQPDLLEGT